MNITAKKFRIKATTNNGNAYWIGFGVGAISFLKNNVSVPIPIDFEGCSNDEGSIGAGFLLKSVSSPPLIMAFTSATDVNIDSYSILNDGKVGNEMMSSWTLEYSNDDGQTWLVGDTQSNKTFEVGVKQTFGYVAPQILTAEQIAAADKSRMSEIVAKFKAGLFVDDGDSIFFTLGGSSAKESAVMTVLDNGGGYNELAALTDDLSMSDAVILRILSIYLIKTDVPRYESESALELITNATVLKEFHDYLTSHGITPPPITSLLTAMRSNIAVFNAARAWAAARVF